MPLSDIIPYLRYRVHRHCPAAIWQVGPRTIPDHELVLITAGCGQVRVDGKEHDIYPGYLLYFWPGVQHTLKNDPMRPMSFQAIHFSYTQASYNNGQWQSLSLDDVPLPVPAVQLSSNCKHLETLFKDIGRHWPQQPAGNSLICRGLFLQVLHQIISGSSVDPGNQRTMAAVQATLDIIHAQYSDRLSVRDLSAKAGLSADYYTRLFRRMTGMTPQDYISYYRISMAKNILADPAVKIRSVAARVGYEDEFFFSRMFKKQVGISPQAFRQLMDSV